MESIPNGAQLRAAREAAGLSLSALSVRTHYSKPLLGKIETGKREIHPEHIMAYSRALNVPVAALMAPFDDPLRIAHEWLVTESVATTHCADGRRIGNSLATKLEERVIELRHLDDSVSGTDLLPVVVREFEDVRRVISECSYTSEIGRRLRTSAGELAQLVGWVASDAGRYFQAQCAYLDGAKVATEAGNQVLVGQLFSSLAYQLSNIGNPSDATLLAKTAVEGAKGATPVVQALLTERVAWALARSRDRDGAMRALDAVDDLYERRSSSIEEPEWVYWLDRSEINVMAGRCFVELGEPDRASPLLLSAIEGYPKERTREVALYQTWLAESYLRNRDIDAAEATIAAARRAADTVHSARLDRRVNEIESMLSK
ncbi:helix-turn-helix transcriptional regulator [Nocardia sp. XZ_19_369]|uniref:helix-turn-helix domain-containing protein n=1 Tax=Nocardia sp. XZ_19_369 TaxID=2769487 RepID=UPI00188F4DF3|nr:helix-turn-helix transcriptional regulator [Nocardia sp. XZ_19_369]